jgi:hypothetical protein
MGAQKQTAGTMDTAVSGLERRLAAGGGNDGDWELLAMNDLGEECYATPALGEKEILVRTKRALWAFGGK